LEEVSTDQQVLLVNEMKTNVIKLIEDQNGNHVVQKCIERLPPEKVAFIVDELRTNVDKMAMHCYGCRVVQRVLEHCLPAQTKGILEELVQNLLSLFRDQYGNYVVQHILEHGRPVDRERILDLVKQMPLELSCHKFASNVVEKGLLLGDARERSVIIRAIIGDPREPQRLQMMVRDRFANYVVQRLLDVAEQSQKEEVFWILKDASTVSQLKKTSYGKHILGKLEQIATQVAPSAAGQFSTFSP
jgi:pumilio RNA-binding family